MFYGDYYDYSPLSVLARGDIGVMAGISCVFYSHLLCIKYDNITWEKSTESSLDNHRAFPAEMLK